jgi:hypothetical protein
MIECYGLFPDSDVLRSNATLIALDQTRSRDLYDPPSLGNFAPSATSVLLAANKTCILFLAYSEPSTLKEYPKKKESSYQHNDGTWKLLSSRDDGVLLPTPNRSECQLTA